MQEYELRRKLLVMPLEDFLNLYASYREYVESCGAKTAVALSQNPEWSEFIIQIERIDESRRSKSSNPLDSDPVKNWTMQYLVDIAIERTRRAAESLSS